jgi:arsenite-transporting ATPase
MIPILLRICTLVSLLSLGFSQYHTDAVIDAEGHVRVTSFNEDTIKREYENSLESLIEAAKGSELKFVFVGGKGGVGKTTSSSAIATLFATVCKKRVLLVSTDPAHSLGDAWRTSFSNVPSSPIENLDVMELDPSQMMENELSAWVNYAREFTDEGGNVGDNAMLGKINSFQDWLSGIPGIDEATALSAAITHIESGKYDIIVFDTAPTGHTLKLLALPEILEQGIEKLQSWTTQLWGYWDAFKGLTTGVGTSQAAKRSKIREEITQRMIDYKTSIQKVAKMLQDQNRTRFVVVCIAEFLSVSETRRLLQELSKNAVKVSHIVVNQLVIQDSLSRDELAELENQAEVGDFGMSAELLHKTIHACRLTSSRKNIQTKYLNILKGYKETQEVIEGICEVPLLAEEVTGADAIRRFSKLMIKQSINDESFSKSTAHVPIVGDVVRISGLQQNDYLNGIEGIIVSDIDTNTGRCGISIVFEEKTQTLALLPKNMSIVKRKSDTDVEQSSKHVVDDNDDSNNHEDEDEPENHEPIITEAIIDKAKAILEDPEIKQMIAQEPRVQEAIKDCLENPMNAIKYMMDPELNPFLLKAMSKIR